MTPDRPISKDDVVALLASALGQDKAEEVVMQAARSLGLPRTTYAPEDVREMFARLVKAEGLVGVVARFAVSRGDVDKLVARARESGPSSELLRAEPRAVTAPAPALGASPAIDLAHLIAPALGEEKAREAIEQAAVRRGVDTTKGLSYDAALSVLDEMTKSDGIVGVVARFAKARFLLEPYK